MISVLKNFHAIPGIIGGLLAESDGSILAHSFPPIFDVSAMQSVCGDVNNCLAGMQDVTGGVKLLDLRFDQGRVIVRQMPAYYLLLLCEQQVNLPLLLISINVAVNSLKPLMDTAKQSRPKAVPQPVKANVSSTRLDKIVEASIASGMI
jgi:predicted regulator of Ras-like GTPase activity (Roadblock/LC7/MglB family)